MTGDRRSNESPTPGRSGPRRPARRQSSGRQVTPAQQVPVQQAPVVTQQVPAQQAPVATQQVPAQQAPVATQQVPAQQAPVATQQVPAQQAPVATQQVSAPAEPVPAQQVPVDTEQVSAQKGALPVKQVPVPAPRIYAQQAPVPAQQVPTQQVPVPAQQETVPAAHPAVEKVSTQRLPAQRSSTQQASAAAGDSNIRGRKEKMGARPVQIVVAKDDHTFELDEAALQEILLQDHVKDKTVVVVSVAGAFRKGKSFLLDFFLRYLKAQGRADWMGTDEMPLDGFSWRGGSERDTTGILLWSEVFIVDLPTGEQVAVLLMDTQGAFDSESTVRDCATIFALSTMVSSVQIYNLLHNIQEDDLQHLQLFTEYGRLALEDSGTKPFQKLQFLVRDWSFPYEAEYGESGGRKILDRRLQISKKQHPELQSLRQHIRSCFSDISCFLMPHPGLKVATHPEFDGKLSDIENDFKVQLQRLIPMLLAPENLVPKEIAGQKVKAKELLQYFKSYIEIYKGDELPEPKSMLVATAEGNNLAAVAVAKDTYKHDMEEVCGGTKPYLSSAHLEAEHNRVKDKAIHQFRSKRKMGGDEFSEKYREALEKDLDEMFVQFKLHNESKNIFKAARTPAVFLSIAVVFYLASGIFGLLGIYTMANMCNLTMGTSLLVLILWAYIRYSGELSEIGEQLDEMANFLWQNVMKPVYQHFVEVSIQQAVIQATESVTSVNSTQANGKLKHT
ncbi:atlastin isoform X1 [Schistocerca serialis cubense]|uniref:atlastin isoform X1 n=2 Tax=Schistocerca serialis cubense TaxID=2023355 RepID=UPI00214E1D21|nr:atlastin isoform X1 [Schistocerca serialis cubense]